MSLFYTKRVWTLFLIVLPRGPRFDSLPLVVGCGGPGRSTRTDKWLETRIFPGIRTKLHYDTDRTLTIKIETRTEKIHIRWHCYLVPVLVFPIRFTVVGVGYLWRPLHVRWFVKLSGGPHVFVWSPPVVPGLPCSSVTDVTVVIVFVVVSIVTDI